MIEVLVRLLGVAGGDDRLQLHPRLEFVLGVHSQVLLAVQTLRIIAGARCGYNVAMSTLLKFRW